MAWAGGEGGVGVGMASDSGVRRPMKSKPAYPICACCARRIRGPLIEHAASCLPWQWRVMWLDRLRPSRQIDGRLKEHHEG